MELGRDLLFFFGALGAFNSLILGFYVLFFKKQYPHTDFFLGIMFVLLAIRAGVSCLYFFGDVPRQLIKLGLSAHLLLGVTTYYFVSYQLTPEHKGTNRSAVHIISLVGILAFLSVFFDFYTWDFNLRYTIHSVLTLYLIATGVRLLPQFKAVLMAKTKPLSMPQKEALTVYLSVIMICLGFVISLYVNYILGPLFFSIFLYLAIAIYFLLKKKGDTKPRYQHKLNPEEVGLAIARLKKLMEMEKPYKDPDFSMSKLASQLSVSRHFLSQMLNDNMNLSYSDLVNGYRIAEAERLIEKNTHYNLEAIAYEVGFNSKSSFYNTFKRIKGTTPSKFRSELSLK